MDVNLKTTPRKSFLAAWLLSLLVGQLGIDRFYLGKIGTGILKLVTLGGLGIWQLVDLIILLTGTTRDKGGQLLEGHEKYKTMAIIITIVFLVLSFILGGVIGFVGAMNSTPVSY